jgi:hypothetical protein
MERTRALRVLGTLDLALGLVAMIAGDYVGELGGFVSGYGLLVVLSAAYLLLGLDTRALRARPGQPANLNG